MKLSTHLYLVCGSILTGSAIYRLDLTGIIVGVLFVVGTLLTWRGK